MRVTFGGTSGDLVPPGLTYHVVEAAVVAQLP